MSRPFKLSATSSSIEPIFEVFNLINSKNIRRPEVTNLIFNFDGTVQSGLGDPRQAQLGLRVSFRRAAGGGRRAGRRAAGAGRRAAGKTRGEGFSLQSRSHTRPISERLPLITHACPPSG